MPLPSNKLIFGDFLFWLHWGSSLPTFLQDKHGRGSDHKERRQWDLFIIETRREVAEIRAGNPMLSYKTSTGSIDVFGAAEGGPSML